MKHPSNQERLSRRRAFTEAVHESSFYVSLAFTVLFFWNLGGGKAIWIAAFVAMGVVIDYTKKSQLDLAAVTVERRERRTRKFVALLMTTFSLLAGLGSSLLRVNAVAAVEAAQADTSSIDAQIALAQTEYNVQIEQVRTSTRIEWRDTSQAKADKASAELKRLYAERDAVVKGSAGGEKTGDMFDLLAKFFRSEEPGDFMVLLLMLAVVSVEVSLWLTAPQYWKDMVVEAAREEEARREQRAAALARPAPRPVPRPAPRPAAAPVTAPMPPPVVSMPEGSKPKAPAELSERLLVVKPDPRKAGQMNLFD